MFVTWNALRHPNVLPLLGVAMSGTRFAMVSKWMPNGNIKQFLRERQTINRFELVSLRVGFLAPSFLVNERILIASWGCGGLGLHA